MAEDLEITGATAGSPRYIVAYLDVNTNNLYDANGNLYGNSTLATTLGNEFILELHYVQDISTSDNPDNWTAWEGLSGMTVSSTLAFDDNYVHAVEATVAENTTAGSTKVKINVPEISKDVLSSSGTLVFNPFGIEPEDVQQNETRPVKQIVSYNAFNYISGTVFEFTIEDAQGLPIDVAGGENATPVRVSDPLYLFVGTDAIYESNIPNRYGEGVFKFPMNINSRKLIKALDYSGASGVSGTMEHNIYVKRTTIAGIEVGSYDVTCVRDSSQDSIAVDSADSKPYLFCCWTGTAQDETVYTWWTKGIDINENSYVYEVYEQNGTKVANSLHGDDDISQIVYTTDSVLFRTFAFPFIVKNLVDYGNSITIPVENTDWTKDYIISIIRNNMEIVIGKASTATYGTVMVGGSTANIDIDDGVISVKDASTENKGVVQLVDSTSDTTSTNKAVTPNYVKTIADTKQDNLTFDMTTGIEVVSGTTVKNDIATVEEVLTGTTGTNIVDAYGLTGALSVGQAVDVSCAARYIYGFSSTSGMSIDGGSTWIDDNQSNRDLYYLQEVRYKGNTGSNGASYIGFDGGASRFFPKYAEGLRYLFIADVKLVSGATQSRISWVKNNIWYRGETVTLSTTEYKRVYAVVESNAVMLYLIGSANVDFDVYIKNWRQYEVTALTDEAIAYIAQLPDPDAFFRSTSAYSIRDKYLIKQDMVCPFIPTINMPDNSDLTVATGLSYKIKYTNDNTHTITADTIPTDAYGWDTHIQMFIKGTSAINFQKPLVLMDALTPNAGHNLSVKWRNGDALVYVDDTNAGNIVISTSGTTAGTLNYYLLQDPGSGQDNYIIFGVATDGAVCDAGTVTVNYNTDILGNGTDKTTISGNMSAASGKTVNVQSLTIDGSTFGGAGYTHLSDTSLVNTTLDGDYIYFDDVSIPFGSTVTKINATANDTWDTLVLDGTLQLKNRQTLYDSIVTGSGSGAITGDLTIDTQIRCFSDTTFNNITFDSIRGPGSGSGGALYLTTNNAAYKRTHRLNNCVFRNCIAGASGASGNSIILFGNCDVYLDGCTCYANPNQTDRTVALYHSDNLYVTNCDIEGIVAYNQFSQKDIHTQLVDVTGILSVSKIGGSTRTSNAWSNLTVKLNNDSTLDFYKFKDSIGQHAIATAQLVISNNVSIVATTGSTATIDACIIGDLNFSDYNTPYDASTNTLGVANIDSITITSSLPVWSATNIIFASPLDANEANTIKLTGTTFTKAAKTLNANRIQLPAATTVSFSGNTNATDTKILDASLIVVGDNPASPSGSATVVNAAGTSSTVSGIGTYIDKEGDNDFVANNTTNVVAVDDSTTGAKYLGTVLSATTGETGANRFAKIDSGAVAVVNEATNAVNKQIITHDYEPILGGTFSLTSATVNEATKTTTILSGGTMSIVDIRGGKDSVIKQTSGNLINTSNVHASNIIFSGFSGGGNGAFTINSLNNCTFTNCIITGYSAYNGAMFGNASASVSPVFSNCTFSGNSGHMTNGAGAGLLYSGTYNFINCAFADNFESILLSKDANITFGGTIKESSFVYATTSHIGSVTLNSDTVLDLTGNTNSTPIAPGGGIKFKSGGATVLVGSGTASSSYMMDNVTLPAGAKLTNTAAVDLNGGQLLNPSNSDFSVSGATITNGVGANNLPAIDANQGNCVFTNVSFVNNTAVNNNGVVRSVVQAEFHNCVFNNNTAYGRSGVLFLSRANILIDGCTFGSKQEIRKRNEDAATITIKGNNTIYSIKQFDSDSVGTVVISSGASIALADSIGLGENSVQVVGGTCTVNGVTVEPGTYTSIVSSGGSAVINQ